MTSKTTTTLFIRILILALLILWAALLVKPFLGVLAWAVILAVAIYPLHQKIVALVGEKRKKLASTILTIVAVALIAIPTYSLFSSVIDSTSKTIQQIKDDTLVIVPPTEKVKDWPMGDKIYKQWKNASEDLESYASNHKDFILDKGEGIISSFLGIMGTLVLLIVSLIIAVVFMHSADGQYKSVIKLSEKLVGKDGEDLVIMSRNTIRSVVKGILLVAIIQSLLSFIGFKLFGLPAAGLFSLLILFAAIVQLPVTLAIIPPIIVMYSVSDNGTANLIFTIYIIAVSLVDNFLKPVLLSKGLETPTVIIFLGAIGGVMLHGIIGLFVGTVVLALMYRLYVYWVNTSEDA
ncbi:AI-2E family transporter [Gaetbulibacter saemankumensis]|uniref:AI-2E family transporter n=1 Tax=Gaetbulibacter saemankumensis TaxID=311208 RepID=UPI000687A30D|nr:AI-2E family transporter [Gaetbulibacter saemankumensis]